MQDTVLEEMRDSILELDDEKATRLAREALAKDIDPLQAVESGFAKGLSIIGERFSNEEIFLPELMLAAEVMNAALGILEPEIAKRGARSKSAAKIVLGTVEGDIHNIGKNIVKIVLSAGGFSVYDIGVDAAIENFIEKALDVDADIIGASALMTTTMAGQKKLIDTLKEKELRDKFKVMVGGAATTKKWAEDIGADGYAEDAVKALEIARSLVQK